MPFPTSLCRALVLIALAPISALAQDKPALKVELNAVADVKESCRVTFLLTNGMPGEISKAALEFALFNKAGGVERLTALNFGRLQKGRTVVRQFDIPGGPCGAYSRILVNAVKSCDGMAGETDACEAALTAANKTGVDFGL
ncbi:hypothetical protein [Rhizobium sp. C4]|uniref:hypothetical protein n=1 Tax=Rhizobium sp. C4 TaxID=1349800 RepID=UPI001E312B22|nr:hypothetical protein [Rhizobium sp. C4]MCD2172091.1 hypothetical protein [Rhizobium sp. C4]